MVILTHRIFLRRPAADLPIDIRIGQPEDRGTHWACRYDISWPEGDHGREGTGSDALQALVIAMQMIGSEIYTSSYHKDGALYTQRQDEGYGFPVPYTIRHLLVGSDSLDFGLATQLPEH